MIGMLEVLNDGRATLRRMADDYAALHELEDAALGMVEFGPTTSEPLLEAGRDALRRVARETNALIE